jgi:hypothetical protein
MVYIFGGIDFPVFEMLFIVSILLLVGLVIIIIGILSMVKEIRQLRHLLTEEESDIQEFEKDIGEMELYEGKDEDDNKVEEYIWKNLEKHFSWEDISNSLKSQGWPQDRLDKIYKKIKKSSA